MKPINSVLITGANAGLGLESARQLARQASIQKIYLACRNESKAKAAKALLESETGRFIFEVVLIDVMDLASVRAAVTHIHTPIDAIVLNAGGMGGATPNALTADGVSHIFAVNVLGHAVLIDELLKRQLINAVVLYAGSEAARGIAKMGVARPELKTTSGAEFVSIANGSKFDDKTDPMVIYGAVKLTAALWISSMARQHPQIRFITVSPGGTTGTKGMDDLPLVKKILFKYIGGVLMPLFGMMHSVDVGAKRYLDGLNDSRFETGRFYASKGGSPTGSLVDQSTLYPAFENHDAQDNASDALYLFMGGHKAKDPLAQNAQLTS